MNVFFGITTRTFRYDRTIARFEPTGGTGLTQPVDLALGPDGQLYVLNRGREWRSKPRMTLDGLPRVLAGRSNDVRCTQVTIR